MRQGAWEHLSVDKKMSLYEFPSLFEIRYEIESVSLLL